MPRDRSPTDAEDVLQEILIAIIKPEAGARSPLGSWAAVGGRSLRTWLGVFVRNRAIDAIRRRYEAPTGDPPPAEETVDERPVSIEMRDCLLRVIEHFRAEAGPDDLLLLDLVVEEAPTEKMREALHLRQQDAVFARVARLKKRLRELKSKLCG